MAERIKTMGQKRKPCKPINYRERLKDQSWYHRKDWLTLRNAHIKNNPLCVACYSDGIVREARHVDHIKPRKLFPELALDPKNLCSYCVSCHSKKTAEEKREQKQNRSKSKQ